MTRMTPGQFRMFETARAKPNKNERAPRVKRKKEDLPENIVTAQIKDYLEARGYTVTRQHVGTYTPYRILLQLTEALKRGADMAVELEKARHNIIRIGKEGDADWRAEKRVNGVLHQLLYLEMKAPGKKPDPHQLLWLEQRRATGTPADWFDSFDVGKRPFLRWYRAQFEPSLPLSSAEMADQDF